MAHIANGIYSISWTPDAAGEWTVYTSSASPKFHKTLTYFVGKAIEADIPTTAMRGTDNALLAASYTAERGTDSAATEAKQDVIDGFHDVPAADSGDDNQMRDVIGKKNDAATQDADATTKSIISMVKGILDVLADTDGVATWPGGQTPANNVSIQEVIEQIYDEVAGLNGSAMVGTNSAALAAVLGALADAAQQDADSVAFTVMSHIKGLHDVLWDADGVVAWAAGAAPGNGVSISEAIRFISERVDDQVNKTVFWSASQEEVQLGGAADVTLPDVVLPNIAGTIVRVYAVFKFRALENTNVAVNKLDGATSIRIKTDGGTWGVDDIAAIDFVDDQFGVAASTREMGDVVVGDNDLVSEVTAFNDTYELRWEDGASDENNLNFNDVQTGLIVEWY